MVTQQSKPNHNFDKITMFSIQHIDPCTHHKCSFDTLQDSYEDKIIEFFLFCKSLDALAN